MNADWLTRLLLGAVIVLLALNLFRSVPDPAFAFRPQEEAPNIIRLDAKKAMVLLGDEVILLGARRVFEQPFDNHTVEILARESLTE